VKGENLAAFFLDFHTGDFDEADASQQIGVRLSERFQTAKFPRIVPSRGPARRA
jgi:hypothetical protein